MATRFFPNYNDYRITSKFGNRTLYGKPDFHSGIDLVAKAANGSSRVDYITAHSAGKIDGTGYDASAGNWVRIRVSEKVFMFYYHLRDKCTLAVGTEVRKGQVIGYMGSTGNSTGAHLHFGIKDDGKWVDPEPYLNKDYVEVKPEPKPEPAKKTNEELAKEVINGNWGNGQDRKNRLTAAGYNYNEVQAIVDVLMGKTKPQTTVKKKTVDELAREVINGDWGNGQDRVNRLTAAGYNYGEVQARVDAILKKPTTASKKTIEELAREVINGRWGNGMARKNALTAAGYNYAEVQSMVNKLLKK